MNLYDHNINSDQKSILHLPMFCRLSLKDVKENCHNYRKQHGPERNPKEPSSPKVSCIGQVKRNNRVISPNTTMMHHHQLTTKPRKSSSSSAFTSRTLLPNATNMLNHASSRTTRSCRSIDIDDPRKSTSLMVVRRDGVNCCRKIDLRDDNDDKDCVDVSDMDPPLPVVKRFGQGRGEIVSIWKRRFNGDCELKTLKIEYNNPAAIFNRPPTTV